MILKVLTTKMKISYEVITVKTNKQTFILH